MSLSREIIMSYPGDVWIETGCGGGDTLRAARQAGYKRLYGCDLRKDLLSKAGAIARNVSVERCDSPKFLEKKLVQEGRRKGGLGRITIFLDAHKTDDEDVTGTYPLKRELEIIGAYAKMKPIVMIDDMRLFGWFGVSIDYVKDMIGKLGPCEYHAIDSVTNKGDVLVVVPRGRL